MNIPERKQARAAEIEYEKRYTTTELIRESIVWWDSFINILFRLAPVALPLDKVRYLPFKTPGVKNTYMTLAVSPDFGITPGFL